MKSKKLLFSTFLSVGCIAAYLIFTSSATAQQGVMGASQNGCGSCHGNAANVATSITVTGLPAGGYVPGTNYPLQVKVTNATKLGAGFDMSVTGGTISNAPANTMLMGGGTELHHTLPLNMVGGTSTWNFNWTAPATNSVTFHVAGNAVNNNNSDSGDQWNKVSLVFNKAVPTNTADHDNVVVMIYPNPASNQIVVRSADAIDPVSFTATAMNGSIIRLQASRIGNDEYKVETASLSTGHYILNYTINGQIFHTSFTRN